MINVRLLATTVVFFLAACETTTKINSAGEWLRSQPPLKVGSNVEISAETGLVAGGLAILEPVSVFTHAPFSSLQGALLYIIYDPLAPNWRIEEQALNEDTYYLSMRAKSFRTGGDGESVQILKRRALKLQREKGYASYRILDYSEGIESSTPLTHRVSEGTIQLVKKQSAGR